MPLGVKLWYQLKNKFFVLAKTKPTGSVGVSWIILLSEELLELSCLGGAAIMLCLL